MIDDGSVVGIVVCGFWMDDLLWYLWFVVIWCVCWRWSGEWILFNGGFWFVVFDVYLLWIGSIDGGYMVIENLGWWFVIVWVWICSGKSVGYFIGRELL